MIWESPQVMVMARKWAVLHLGVVVVVLFHVQPGRCQLYLPDHGQQNSFCKESVSPDI